MFTFTHGHIPIFSITTPVSSWYTSQNQMFCIPWGMRVEGATSTTQLPVYIYAQSYMGCFSGKLHTFESSLFLRNFHAFGFNFRGNSMLLGLIFKKFLTFRRKSILLSLILYLILSTKLYYFIDLCYKWITFARFFLQMGYIL